MSSYNPALSSTNIPAEKTDIHHSLAPRLPLSGEDKADNTSKGDAAALNGIVASTFGGAPTNGIPQTYSPTSTGIAVSTTYSSPTGDNTPPINTISMPVSTHPPIIATELLKIVHTVTSSDPTTTSSNENSTPPSTAADGPPPGVSKNGNKSKTKVKPFPATTRDGIDLEFAKIEINTIRARLKDR